MRRRATNMRRSVNGREEGERRMERGDCKRRQESGRTWGMKIDGRKKIRGEEERKKEGCRVGGRKREEDGSSISDRGEADLIYCGKNSLFPPSLPLGPSSHSPSTFNAASSPIPTRTRKATQEEKTITQPTVEHPCPWPLRRRRPRYSDRSLSLPPPPYLDRCSTTGKCGRPISSA